MTNSTEIIESLTGQARTALLGTLSHVHPSYGSAVTAELYHHRLMNTFGNLTSLGHAVRVALLGRELDKLDPPPADPREELVTAVLAWGMGAVSSDELVQAVLDYRLAVGQ
jgi:hypothetical protein